jgi:glycosyltransferase involved in cell wall biosynthesis
MKLTIGMACYNDMNGVYFSVQALRAYHDLKDVEILVIDNYGDTILENWINAWCHGKVRYEKYLDNVGTTQPRQKVFELAKGEFVYCIDSHVMLLPGSLKLFDTDGLIHGIMIYDDLETPVTHMESVWRGNMWGIWNTVDVIPEEPFEIPMHGLGFFGSRKDSWLGFNPDFRGFGGEEGYIHEKYRQAGRKIYCVPWIKWLHRFGDLTPESRNYPLDMRDRIRNYLLGFEELGLDKTPIYEHFGRKMVSVIEQSRTI